ncbi:uncharacterized protein A4U43_C02F2040 [Asparagus officinalis]|uniref:Exocyst subunit Exo70 family protein n=1 Tax=Asparagus officinalis TaxID=4686 RepID=A0A5P1FF46_ASPOF|nr:uncharacterized protein A4U43_C02F2040 [Asparagus officinalis]
MKVLVFPSPDYEVPFSGEHFSFRPFSRPERPGTMIPEIFLRPRRRIPIRPSSSSSIDSAMSMRVAWLILVLLCKLDGKAEIYKDVALSYLFLANNLQYVVKKVKESRLTAILGYDWVFKHEAKVKQAGVPEAARRKLGFLRGIRGRRSGFRGVGCVAMRG